MKNLKETYQLKKMKYSPSWSHALQQAHLLDTQSWCDHDAYCHSIYQLPEIKMLCTQIRKKKNKQFSCKTKKQHKYNFLFKMYRLICWIFNPKIRDYYSFCKYYLHAVALLIRLRIAVSMKENKHAPYSKHNNIHRFGNNFD